MRRKNAHTVKWLSVEQIDGQQSIPFFVIIPGYVTHYKLWCDMSA